MSHLARAYLACVLCLVSLACGSSTDSQSKAKAEAAAAAEIDARLKQQPPPPKNALEGLMAGAAHQGSLAEAMVSRSTTPAFTSPRLETKKAHDGQPSGLMPLLPEVKEQVAHVWIGWYKNHAVDAFVEAINANKPLVLVLGDSACGDCQELIRTTLRCPAVERWAGDAVFAYSDPALDLGATAFKLSLHIDAAPAVTVLDPEARILLERGRINGFFDAGDMGKHLGTILRDTPRRVFPGDTASGAVVPTPQVNAAPEPTAAAASAGAIKLKLVHAAPAPVCR